MRDGHGLGAHRCRKENTLIAKVVVKTIYFSHHTFVCSLSTENGVRATELATVFFRVFLRISAFLCGEVPSQFFNRPMAWDLP